MQRREREPETLGGHRDNVPAVALGGRPGGLLASVSRDGTLAVWDVIARKALLEPVQAHTGELTSIAVSPDGKTIALGGADGTVAFWTTDVASSLDLGCGVANRKLSLLEWREIMGVEEYETVC